MVHCHVLLSLSVVALIGVGCNLLDYATCEERRDAGLCVSRPLETARLCPEACEGNLLQSSVRRRVSVDGAVPPEVCNAILNLQGAIRPGDGYGGQKHPHTPYELFGGITPRAAAHWAVSLPDAEARAKAVADVKTLIDAVMTVKQVAERALAEVQPDLPELHMDFVQLACRERVAREDLDVAEPDDEALPNSMAIHADNCWRDQSTDECRRETPFFHWRTHSAHLYLDSPGEGDRGFEGGELFFSDGWGGSDQGEQRAVVPPQCGRLVAFTAGPENLHGVRPLARGRRCALSVWMSADSERAVFTQELEVAVAVLAGNSTAMAFAQPRPGVEEYYEGCAKAVEAGEEPPVLEEVEREVDGNVMTFQVLSRAPQLTRILNFLTVEEADRVIKLSALKMAPALVFEGKELTTMNYRTSQTAWLTPAELDKGFSSEDLSRRIELVTGLSLDSAEDLQIAFYGGETHGKYEPHMDWGVEKPTDVRRDFDHMKGGIAPGGRLATLLIYLNDVPAGGHTAFTRQEMYVKPQAGSAIFWYNLIPGESGALGDVLTRHGGCPVVRGVKYIATRWLHERGNEALLRLPSGVDYGYLWRDWRDFKTSIVAKSEDSPADAETRVCDGEGGTSGQCAGRDLERS